MTMIAAQTMPELKHNAQNQLRRWYMAVDGNAHAAHLCPVQLGFGENDVISESLIPNIRLIASLIAAKRHSFQSVSPDVFTEEADWFAARILVLQVQNVYLNVSLVPMLKVANARAKAFAQEHSIDFQAANMKMSLHAGRPENLLIIETTLGLGHEDEGLVRNSQLLNRLSQIKLAR